MDELDSMYSIAGLTGATITDAKSLIYNSQIWSEVRKRDEQQTLSSASSFGSWVIRPARQATHRKRFFGPTFNVVS